jgi:FixJ family two-component response regulator
MVMPGMRGTQLAIEARKLRAGLPVVLMSGYTRDAALNDVDLEGATVFLEKPFTPETLTLQVRAALG